MNRKRNFFYKELCSRKGNILIFFILFLVAVYSPIKHLLSIDRIAVVFHLTKINKKKRIKQNVKSLPGSEKNSSTHTHTHL